MDYDQFTKNLTEIPSVASVSTCSHFCDQTQCSKIVAGLSKKGAKRIVVGACDRGIYDPSLTEALNSSRINRGLVWGVNIREQCAWVHTEREATQKGLELLNASIRRVERANALKTAKSAVDQRVLIYGGAVAAMEAAAILADLGHQVVLVNTHQALGGMAARVPQLYGSLSEVAARIKELEQKILAEKRIRLLSGSTISAIDGELGRYSAVVESESGKREAVSAGAVILAPEPGPSSLIKGIAEIVQSTEPVAKKIAILMDLDGEQGTAVSEQVFSAAEMLVGQHGAEVKVYCHNVRVAAPGLENLYRRARQAGVVIVKYESPPVVNGNKSAGTGPPTVTVIEPTIGVRMTEEFDLILSADVGSASGANGSNGELSPSIAGLLAGPDHDPQADSVWLLPAKTNREGIFVVGSPQGTADKKSAQIDGLAAAAEIHDLLRDRVITALNDEAKVDEIKCVLCLTCLRVCPHGAVQIDAQKGAATVSAVACKRCGICVSHCPAKAIDLPGYTEEQLEVERGTKPGITLFACENSGLPAANLLGVKGIKYDSKIRLLRMPCAGRLQPGEVLSALEAGAERVIILACHQENCKYLTGSTRAAKRIETLRATLEKAGFDKNRVSFGELASVEPGKFLSHLKGSGQ
jgi:heterodisulfide reductase subunit A-like polyferredoxin/coenzyme F420-reducing hydrogenase delta subunit